MTRVSLAFVWLAIVALAPAIRVAHAAGADDGFAKYLGEREIDRERRRVLEEAGPWDDARQRALIRVLERLAAPAALEVPWRLAAQGPARPPAVEDRLLRVAGRATFVGVQRLTEEQAVLADRPTLDVVRFVAADGGTVDVVVPEAPKSWPRWQRIDEPAFALALPLSTASAPVPGPPPADGPAWPAEPPGLLVAATGIGWEPPTPLGDLGMDYGLFETVVDNAKLVGGDTAAFYAMLAAVGRAGPGVIEAAAGKTTDVLPMIDPAQKWFASHRGDPVTVAGIARRAVRIAIDEQWRRGQVGADHYWELYVFVATPLLQVNDRRQDDYPIVCCVRELPAGFPTGDAIGEKVAVSGFALKRYLYPLPDLAISSSQGDRATRNQKMAVPLLIGRTLAWTPDPSLAGATSLLSWVFTALAAAVGLALVYGLWSMNRRGGRRAELPERIDLPEDRG